MIRITKNALACTIRSNVPSIEVGDLLNPAGLEVEAFQREWPDSEDEVAGRSEEGLVHDKFVVPVVVKAFNLSRFTIQQVHSRSRVTRELNELVIQRVKLRMDD